MCVALGGISGLDGPAHDDVNFPLFLLLIREGKEVTVIDEEVDVPPILSVVPVILILLDESFFMALLLLLSRGLYLRLILFVVGRTADHKGFWVLFRVAVADIDADVHRSVYLAPKFLL